jgi:hypothetical protein
MSAATMTPTLFAIAVEGRLGIKPTAQNVRDFTAWETQEGGNWQNTAKYNPLNTTLNETGASAINSVGVKAYTSWQQGINATADTLKNYPGIQAALKSNASPSAFSSAVASSPWGTGAVTAAGTTPTTAQLQQAQSGGNVIDSVTGAVGGAIGGAASSVAGAAGSVVNSVTGVAGDAITSAIDAVFGGFFDMIKSDAEKAMLIAVLVGGGMALATYGLVRLVGAHPPSAGSGTAGAGNVAKIAAVAA